MGYNKKTRLWEGASKSEDYLNNRSDVPQVSALMARSVSQSRKDSLSGEVSSGLFRDGSSTNQNNSGMTRYSNVTSSVGMKKSAQIISGGGFSGSSGDTVKQAPEVYSPLWLNSNLNLPRDRATINAWCRSFFALNPFVQNAISLHSTYPISKLNIKCSNKDIERFFNDMIEETDLMNVCSQIAQEYFLLGECFPYAELDESKGKWSRFMIQNPDYMIVKRTVVANEPIIMLRPDENLKKIIFSNRPNDIEQRKQLNQHIIDSVRRGENIPLDNFHVSHLARRISPYEIRGTGLPVCIFRQLMLFDKLRECYSTDSEVLTDKGFKTIDQLINNTTNLQLNPNYVNGIELDQDGKVSSVLTLKEDFKIACVNPETNEIEYHKPTELHMSAYKGKMLHFSGKKIDSLVSPNHKMWVKEQTNGKWGEYQKIPASKMLEKKKYWKFNSKSKYVSGNDIKSVNICDKEIPIELYLKVLGYVVSEGCVYENFENGRYDSFTDISQLTSSDCYEDMKQSFQVFAEKLNKNCVSKINIKGSGYSKNTPKEKWEGRIHGKDLTQYFKNEIGVNNSTLSADKHLPRWVLNLKPELLNIVLNSLMLGDGSDSESKYGTGSKSFRYSTISKQLADDVYELVYKVGYVPNICVSTAKKSDDRVVTEYIVLWSTTDYGNEPLVYTGKKSSDNNGGGATVEEVDYDGVVWCFEVPTGLFITRRNGKIAIHGNSKFAQADGMVNPLTLVKVGGEGNDALHPTFADIEAFREIFECHDEETEVFTEDGFKKFDEVMNYSEENEKIIPGSATPKDNIKIACFNPENDNLEYHTPKSASLYNYDGDMYHFKNEKMDLKVTPNHDLWVSEKKYQYNGHRSLRKTYWDSWKKIKASEININDCTRLRSKIKWEGSSVDSVNVTGHDVPIKIYLEYLGYLLSEVGSEDDFNKKIPAWILNLNTDLLKILLDALVKGDRSVHKRKNKDKNGFSYYTTSKELADDVYEIVYKCGYVPTMFIRDDKKYKGDNRMAIYNIMWSNSGKGEFPNINKTYRNSVTKEKTNILNIEKYSGKVWCLEVPTGLFITRRNGKITIQGNSAQYDKDFKIFTHAGVTVERVGFGQGIYDISGDITQLIKEIFIGLQVPPVIMDGGSDTTYSNGGVALDALRQRYLSFRNMMSIWLKNKIFAPISKIQGFYDYTGGEKQLIIPEIDWNHMSLFDAGDYINTLVTLTQGEHTAKRASIHTLYRSMGLEYEDEQRKIRKEAIQNAIILKEEVALGAMDLNSLRALDEEDEIPEAPVQPGQKANDAGPVPGEMPGGMPGLDLGPSGGMPSPPPSLGPPPTGGSPAEAPPSTSPPPSPPAA